MIFAYADTVIARAFTNTFAGIRPSDVPWFVVTQISGAFAATWLFQRLTRELPAAADRVEAIS